MRKNICIALAIIYYSLSSSVNAQALLLAISEGTSGGLDAAQVIAKYKDVGDAIGRGMKASVNVVFVRDFATLEEGLKTNRYAFVMARPSDYPARAMRDSGYNYVANAKPDGQCYIVVKKDSPLKTLADIKGKKIALPEKVAYMSKFCAAELRSQGRTASGVTGMRLSDQDYIAGVTIVQKDTELMVISEKGYGKRTSYDEFSTKGRGGKGMTFLKVTEKNGKAVGIASVSLKDEILVITQSGMAIRTPISDVSTFGRTAVGVKIVDTKEDDGVIDFAILSESGE